MAGPFSVATFQHGLMEATFIDAQLMLQRFGFGWQVIDLSKHRRFTTSDILSYGVSQAEAKKLLHGIVPGSTRLNACNPACLWDRADPRDVEEIRKMMLGEQGQAIGPVVVDTDWAMLGWWGEGGGEVLFTKHDQRWKKVTGGGGCIETRDLQKAGCLTRLHNG